MTTLTHAGLTRAEMDLLDAARAGRDDELASLARWVRASVSDSDKAFAAMIQARETKRPGGRRRLDKETLEIDVSVIRLGVRAMTWATRIATMGLTACVVEGELATVGQDGTAARPGDRITIVRETDAGAVVEIRRLPLLSELR